ncbi:Uncharacterised protein [uncultured archaeon]|nr:Uncharacterised protein [uncultured archaeon]
MDNVKSEDYAGDVMPLWQFASIHTAFQMNKAIPLLLVVKENTDVLPQIKANTDAIPQIREDFKAVRKIGEETLGEIKVMRKTTDATLEEIRGLREDIQPGYASNFRRIQADVRAIKDRLGMQ